MNTFQRSSAERLPAERQLDLNRRDLILAVGVGLAVFVIYLRTIAPGLLVDDSGEFQTMTRLLGHTHPTGYEVYTVLGRVFAFVPIGDFATRVSAFSAFMGGVAAGLIYLSMRLLVTPRVIAIVPALAFAAAPTVWSQGIIAEVYTPAAALAAAVIAALLAWRSTGAALWLAVAGAVGGLSLGVHFTTGLYLPAILVFVVAEAARRGDMFSAAALHSTWVPAIAGAAGGIAMAVVLFIAVDIADPPAQYFDAVVAPSHSAWDLEAGEIDAFSTRLSFDWTARQFSGLMFTRDGLMAERWEDFKASLPGEIAWVMLLAAAVGAGRLLWRDRAAAGLLLVAVAVQLVYAFNYDIGDMIYVFYIPVYMLLALLAGVGLAAVAAALEQIRGVAPSAMVPGLAIVALAVGVVPIASPNLTHIVHGTTPPYDYEAYPYDDYIATYMRPTLTAMIAELPDEAIVFGDWDLLYPSFWVAHVDLDRTDLMFHETYPADDQEGLAASTTRYILDQAAIRPVFVAERIPELGAAGASFVPVRVGPTKLMKVIP